MSNIALINKDILNWAIQEASKNEEIKRSLLKFDLTGDISFSDAEKIAKIVQIPFGMLYLKELPESFKKPLLFPEENKDINIKTLVKISLSRLDFYQEYLNSNDLCNSNNTFFDWDNWQLLNPKTTDYQIIKYIFKTRSLRSTNVSSMSQLFNALMDRLETGLELLVTRDTVLPLYSKTHLNPNTFKGLGIFNPRSPIIFINDNVDPETKVRTVAYILLSFLRKQNILITNFPIGDDSLDNFLEGVLSNVPKTKEYIGRQDFIPPVIFNNGRRLCYAVAKEIENDNLSYTNASRLLNENYDAYNIIKNFQNSLV